MNASLGTLQSLCSSLGVTPAQLLAVRYPSDAVVTISDLVNILRRYLERKKLTVAEFEERVGYAIGLCLSNAKHVYDWNIDCLRAVCLELEIDWRSVRFS